MPPRLRRPTFYSVSLNMGQLNMHNIKVVTCDSDAITCLRVASGIALAQGGTHVTTAPGRYTHDDSPTGDVFATNIHHQS